MRTAVRQSRSWDAAVGPAGPAGKDMGCRGAGANVRMTTWAWRSHLVPPDPSLCSQTGPRGRLPLLAFCEVAQGARRRAPGCPRRVKPPRRRGQGFPGP